jgi:hypothetical protein
MRAGKEDSATSGKETAVNIAEKKQGYVNSS